MDAYELTEEMLDAIARERSSSERKQADALERAREFVDTQAAEIKRLRQALQTCVDAHNNEHPEMLRVAIKNAEAMLKEM